MAIRIPPDRPPSPKFEKARALEGSLAVQLASFGEMMSEQNPEAEKAYERLAVQLSKVEAGKNAPAIGDKLPPFLLPDEDGHLIASERLLADGPLVVSFNRGNWCPFCWLELSALQDVYTAIREAGGSVVSITPEVATFSRRLKKPSRAGISRAHRHGQRLRPRTRARGRADRRGPRTLCPIRGRSRRVFSATTPGCCRCRPPWSSVATAWFAMPM